MASEALLPGVVALQPGGEGILPAQELWQFAQNGVICSHREIDSSQIQPASIDLRLWNEAYRVHASFLPSKSTPFRNKATTNGLFDKTLDIAEPTLLEPRSIHIIRVIEGLALPSDVYGISNAKSTTGRLDIFTRLITEYGDEFDRVPKGYHGDLYLQVVSHTFPILVQCGMKLNQLRLVRGKSNPVADSGLKELAKDDLLVFDNGSEGEINRGLRITVDLQGNDSSRIVAYQAKRHGKPIDLGRVSYYDSAEYWTPISKPPKGYLILDPEEFYLLASKQPVRVGPDHAAEMVPYDPTMGEFHVHYAGFFDPGFGYGAGGEIPGAKAVLEVRAHGMPLLLEDDQFVGRLHYYKMAGTPDKIYGVSIGSSYQQQGLALSKQFKRDQQYISGSSSGSNTKVKENSKMVSQPSITKSQETEADDTDSLLKLAFPDSRAEYRVDAKNR